MDIIFYFIGGLVSLIIIYVFIVYNKLKKTDDFVNSNLSYYFVPSANSSFRGNDSSSGSSFPGNGFGGGGKVVVLGKKYF